MIKHQNEIKYDLRKSNLFSSSSCLYKQETHIPTSKDGILKANENDSFDICESCLLGKMTYATFSKSSERAKDC